MGPHTLAIHASIFTVNMRRDDNTTFRNETSRPISMNHLFTNHCRDIPLRTPRLGVKLFWFTLAAAILLIGPSLKVLFAAQSVAQRVDEKSALLKLLSLDKSGEITWETAEGKSPSSSLEKLVQWGEWKEPGRGSIVWLSGGGWFVGELLALDSEHLTLDSDLFGEMKLPLELLAGCTPHPPSDRTERDALGRKMLQSSGKTDRVMLDNGDELTGKIMALKTNKLEIRTANGPLTLELAKASSFIFNPALAADTRPKGMCVWSSFQDGSRLRLSQLQVDDKKVHANLLGGFEVAADAKSLVALQPVGGTVTYLSDVKPDSFKHVPYLQLPWTYEVDHNVLGGQLRCDGRAFLKGLGMHSAARVTYALDQKYRRFESEIGIDDATRGKGSVVFRVFTDDGSGTWRDQFTSPVVRGGQSPLPISVDLWGVKRLSLLVEFADHGDELDHADWLNARFVK